MTRIFGVKMEIKILKLGVIGTNCYLLSTDKAAIIIDPAFENDKTLEFLNDNKDKERLILITHGHFDHISGALSLRRETGVKIAVGEYENDYLSDNELNMSCRFKKPLTPFGADILLKDNEEITVGDLTFKTIFTPGHTRGGVSFLFQNEIFSGDTLFFESIGRTDFPGGNYHTLINSVKKLLSLDKDYTVYSGHGDKTTLSHEREYNPFI